VVRAVTVSRQRAIHAANNRGAMFSVVLTATVSRQRAIHVTNNTGAVFFVVRAATVARQCAIQERCFLCYGPTGGFITGVSQREQSQYEVNGECPSNL
jgi:hypothetical protein